MIKLFADGFVHNNKKNHGINMMKPCALKKVPTKKLEKTPSNGMMVSLSTVGIARMVYSIVLFTAVQFLVHHTFG